MDVVRMVLAGQVQRELVGLLNQHGPLAVGMTGEDAHHHRHERQPEIDGELVDIGRVGEIAAAINTGAMKALLADGRIPVILLDEPTRTTDMSTTSMLIRRLRLSLRHWAPKPLWSPRTSRASARTSRQQRGDRPLDRLRTGEAAAGAGQRHGAEDGGLPARRAQRRHHRRVIDGRVRRSILLEIFTDEGIGTMVVPDAAGPMARRRR